MKGQGGFTLVELSVVIALIVVLSTAATLAFMQLNEKYQVESLTKDVYSALMKARNDASMSRTPWIASLANPLRLQTGPDANEDGIMDRVAGLVQSPRWNMVLVSGDANIVFDRRGLADQDQVLTIGIGQIRFGATPVMDCLVISSTRTNIGQMSGGNCVQR
ncbi:MAG: prepilin-type N-terminal cleavage/methylation domain-containing protein [Proteobacteria bacterium]|nr:prepilin-type N-terminal cleavage/methylation domain-containing protein [Pseudomonadota bacterium]